MSASVDQISSSVPEQAGASNNISSSKADFDYACSQAQQQGDYQSIPGLIVMENSMPGYYTAPYMSLGDPASQPVSENIMWTTGEPVTYMGGYDVSGNYISGSTVCSGVEYQQQIGYGWFPGVDYGEWGSSFVVGGGNRAYPEGYYFVDGSGVEGNTPANSDLTSETDIKSIEESFDGMTLDDRRSNFSYTMSNGVSTVGGGGGAAMAQNGGTSWILPVNQYSQVKNVVIPRLPMPQNSLDNGTWNGQTLRQHHRMMTTCGHISSGSSGSVAVSSKSESEANVLAINSESFETALNSDCHVLNSSSFPPLNAAGLYNPLEFSLELEDARFFIIKSYSEDDVHRSIKYGIWCSTEYGNKRLDAAYEERSGRGPVYLLYSVNGSGHFCGIAEMISSVDYHATSSIWAQSKWKGQFHVKWIYVKDVPNSQLRHIKLENNENKPVTNSRDTQEVPSEKGKQVMRIIHHYRHTTSIFDDFFHYEQRQEDERKNKENYRK